MAHRMGRVVATVALLAVAAPLGACGKSNPSGSSQRRATASEVVRAQAYAQMVNLTAADVPGFTPSSSSKAPETPAEKRLKEKLQHCVHPATGAPVAEVGSPEFTRELGLVHQSVQSEVTVASSAAAASRELAVIRSRRARRCVTRYFQALVKSQSQAGEQVGPVSLLQRTPPAPGTSGSFAWRISVALTVRRVQVPVYFDIFGFVLDANEVTLFASGIPIPLAPSLEAHLFSVLLERAKAPVGSHPEKRGHKRPKVTTS
jgi:hypothetical protein